MSVSRKVSQTYSLKCLICKDFNEITHPFISPDQGYDELLIFSKQYDRKHKNLLITYIR